MKGARATDTIGRRGLLRGGLAAGALAGAGLMLRRARADSPVALTLSVWGAQAEEEAFKSVIDKYQALHPNVTIRLEVNGNSMQLYQLVDTRLAGRQAPDIFRIQYQQVGRYASAHALIDLTPYLDQGYASQFGPAFWQAVTFQDKQFALPHHTDTFALYLQRRFLAQPWSRDAAQPRPQPEMGRIHPHRAAAQRERRWALRLRHGVAELIGLSLAAVPLPARRTDAGCGAAPAATSLAGGCRDARLDAILVQGGPGAAEHLGEKQRADTESVRQRHHRNVAGRRLANPVPAERT
jgi:hypothetical protein